MVQQKMSQSDLSWFQTGFPLVRCENWHVSYRRVRVNRHVHWYNSENECWPDIAFQGSPRDTNKGLFALEAVGHGLQNLMVPHFLDETLGRPMGHASRAFLHNVNPIWITCIFLIRYILIPQSLKMWLS
jgi:hypothetical protein